MTDVQRMLTGVCPVLEVPFDSEGALDLDGFNSVVEHTLDAGATAVMFPGFASEFLKLATAERHALCDALLPHTVGNDRVAAVISVPDHATRLAVSEATRAAEAGADAINVLPPFQLGPSREAVLAHVEAVISAVDPVPVVVQYAPAQTGTALDATTLRTLADRHPNLQAVKVESVPPGRMISALSAPSPGRALPSLVGYAGLHMIDALRRGAIGVQPGCSFTELYVEIWNSWTGGDHDAAVGLHTRMLPYLSSWMQGVELIVAVEKEISVRRGWFGSAHCRAPGHRLDDEELRTIDRFCADFAPQLFGGADH
ncbi:dihydrodipicolinate synthase family protein [Mycobacterium sp. 21AC1]|uniref:dihydrodipicolinate synthase family protein n=1 Tax=[Mycobacterium] appelbergii TaxID=2939269 RepID=UPI002938E099|nr:dihydrodipicolinate synthase family protein [Mycobacterium sp. 21AC1]MDV3124232.1 dihydrodipicolinate synthase family protein [Mycobacterium sp. 21AC1]